MDAGTVIVEAHADLERLFAAYDGADGSRAARFSTFGAIASALGVLETIEGAAGADEPVRRRHRAAARASPSP
jgi:hypothetical protein